VDDSPVILELFGVTLQANGYEVLTAENGEEGFETFKANPGVSMVISEACGLTMKKYPIMP
jgi:response regulator RpfG family c-di-GMP phosphodiesterase